MVSTTAFVTVTITRPIPANGGEDDRAFVHQMTTYSDSRWCSEENVLISSFEQTFMHKTIRKTYTKFAKEVSKQKNVLEKS